MLSVASFDTVFYLLYVQMILSSVNPLVLSHHYYLNESILTFKGIMSNFSFLFHFSMKFVKANRIAPDGTPLSHLGLFCLHMSHKKDATTLALWERDAHSV